MHGGRDPLEIAPPSFPVEQAQQITEAVFGVVGSLRPLPSERDQNFRVRDREGHSFVLKFSNPGDPPGVVEMQTDAMLHVAQHDPELPIPQVRPTLEHHHYAEIEGPDGRNSLVRLLTFLEGRTLAPSELDLPALHDLGTVVARMGRALRGFFHPAADHRLLWDLKNAGSLRPLVASIKQSQGQVIVERTLERFADRVAPAFSALRAQVIHNDLTLDNVLFGREGGNSGIVDFGDVVHTALVCDLSSTLASVVTGRTDFLEAGAALIRGYGTVTPLEEEEAVLIADLLGARLVTIALISAWRRDRFPENAKLSARVEADAWPPLKLLEKVGVDEASRHFREAAEVTKRRAASMTIRRRDAPPSVDALLRRRRQALGPALEAASYDRPLHLVRAEDVWVFDAEGRRYLDAYNNVPHVGHCHPRVVEAVARQAGTLNTNTRYLYEAVLELAERLTSTMPSGLDVCIFVNSGSEANDLAWRLATAHTGGQGGLVTAGAYHGVTAAAADLSPEIWPSGRRPENVETVPAPNGYRGLYPREQPGWAKRYADHVDEAIDKLGYRGFGLAAFIVDPLFTSDGIFVPSPTYLRHIVDQVHEAGGLYVADEVQAGFGRTGEHLWSFESSEVIPDIVTLGKPMGNGHPVGAVLARSEIVDSFAEGTSFFSTFGGNPVSCVAALAVLDVIEDEKLQARAGRVGSHLRERLVGLATRHDLIGDVRGAGLLLGVELVRDRETREPAGRETHAVVNRMRDNGILLGSTGPHGNVLKVRPPLAFSFEHVELLVGALDETLAALRN